MENKTRDGNDLFSQFEKCKSKRESLEHETSQLKAVSSAQSLELEAFKKKANENSMELRQLLERAISAEKDLSFMKAHLQK